jgi:hypothetical protein
MGEETSRCQVAAGRSREEYIDKYWLVFDKPLDLEEVRVVQERQFKGDSK